MITVVNTTGYHHMQDNAECVNLLDMTLRAALKALRNEHYGNIGGTSDIELSDGTTLSVENCPTSDGHGELMNSQRIVRRSYYDGYERIVRIYKL